MTRIKVALIAPSSLPIPSVKGGAIETLSNFLLDENEVFSKIQFDVFSYFNIQAEVKSKFYKNSRFLFFKPRIADKVRDFIFRLTYHISRRRYSSESSFVHFIKKKLKRNHYDYILIEGNFLQVGKLTKFNTPIILHLHTDILNKQEPMTRRVVSNCDRIFVISDFLKKQIEFVVGKSEKIIVYKNAINLSNFYPNAQSKMENKRRLNLHPEKKVMIYCGRLTPIKGVFEAIKAFHKAAQPDLTFMIVGGSNFADSKPTEYEEKLRAYVCENNLDVVFTGYVPHDELPKYYSAADFSICPSTCNEAAGLVVIEAMAVGLPVIASKKGGIPEYVFPDACSLVESGDSNDIFVQNLTEAIIGFNQLESLPTVARNKLQEYSTENYYKNFYSYICKK